MPRGAVRLRVDVGFASRQQDSVTALDVFPHLIGWLIDVNPDRFAARLSHGIFILRERPFGIFAIDEMRQWNGDSRRMRFWAA
jgi:hypothetical protein